MGSVEREREIEGMREIWNVDDSFFLLIHWRLALGVVWWIFSECDLLGIGQ